MGMSRSRWLKLAVLTASTLVEYVFSMLGRSEVVKRSTISGPRHRKVWSELATTITKLMDRRYQLDTLG